MLASVPNVLTTARLVALVPFCILLAGSDDGQSVAAAVIFAAAAATDFLDGYIARHAHASSRFGRIADPLADRLLINLAVILLAYENRLSWWLAAPLLLRDVYLLITFERRRVATEVRVNRAGKWATATIMLAVLMMMLTTAVWPVVLYTAGLVISLAAACHYLLRCAPRGASHQSRRDGRRGGHAAAAADLQPTQADGAGGGEALHGAHHRAAASARHG